MTRPTVLSTTNVYMIDPTHTPIKQPAVETDPRFLSGPWTGFWLQTGWGKQKMSLSLAFLHWKPVALALDASNVLDGYLLENHGSIPLVTEPSSIPM